MSLLFDKTLSFIRGGLGVRRQRQATVASNIANADTPGYRARRLTFDAALSRATSGIRLAGTSDTHMTVGGAFRRGGALAATDSTHDTNGGRDISPIGESNIEMSEATARTDGNNVDLEQEMSMMARNGMEFQALSATARKKFGLLRYVVMNS